ncbi:MAG: hypothetical protein JXO44_06455 [Clostridia bacterium]|nr:hypothetical protein [Clostridia bacterium]
MKNKYCIKCGKAIVTSKSTCDHCHAPTIEIPHSEAHQVFVENLQKEYEKKPPSRVKGCIATFILMTVLFGIPSVLAYNGLGLDSFIVKILLLVIFGLINISLYKYRKKNDL